MQQLSTELHQQLEALHKKILLYVTMGQQNKVYPNAYHLVQRANTLLMQVLHLKSIDDEQLYALWGSYMQERTKWINETLPRYKAATEEERFLVTSQTRTHLQHIIKSVRAYLNAYEEHKDKIVGAKMQEQFNTHTQNANKDLNTPEEGWLYIQEVIEVNYQRLKSTHELFVKLQEQIDVYYLLLKPWDERVLPNMNALLCDEQDAKTVADILEIMCKIETIVYEIPVEMRSEERIQPWVELVQSGRWEKKAASFQDYYERSQKRKKIELGANENPAIVQRKRKPYTYKTPNEKIQLYQKGKKDIDKIAANDVQQGDLDDCYVLGPIAALAQSNPKAIEDLISVQKDGSYKVTLYLRPNADTLERQKTEILVKKEFVHTKSGKTAYAGKGDGELWVQVLEKAYAQALGGYEYIAKKGDPIEVLEVFTGKTAKNVNLNSKTAEEVFPVLDKMVQNKIPVIMSSMVLENKIDKIILENGQRLISNHAYYLNKVTEKEICLKNPHGKDHLTITWKVLLTYFTKYVSL